MVELLISIGILLLLSAMTLAVVNFTHDSDRVRGAARDLQSFLEGARDRAIYARQPRGVRLLPSATDPSVCDSVVYIGPPAEFTEGTIDVAVNGTITSNTPGNPTFPTDQWTSLRDQGLLVEAVRIKIPNDASSGIWHTMIFDTASTTWTLTRPVAAALSSQSYRLQLAPAVLPNQEPRPMPRGVVVDLDNSIIPDQWISDTGHRDILFAPGGTVTGDLGGFGLIHFVLASTDETAQETLTGNLSRRFRLNAPWQAGKAYVLGNVVVHDPASFMAFRCTTAGTSDGTTEPAGFATATPGQQVTDGAGGLVWEAFARKPNLIVTLMTKTGNVSSHPADVSRTLAVPPVAAPPAWPDTFHYAETGEVAK